MNWSLQASQQWAWCTKLELLTAPPTEVQHNIILKPSCQPFEILYSYLPKLLLRIKLPTCEKLFIVLTILVTITNTQLKIYWNCCANQTLNLCKIVYCPWPFGYYYKYTTQDLPKLLTIKLFLVPTILVTIIFTFRYSDQISNFHIFQPDLDINVLRYSSFTYY